MAAPRFGSVNFVVADLAAAGVFLRSLGADLGPELEDWRAHHVTVAGNSGDVDADLDSTAFAAYWGGVPADLAPGAVLNLDVDTREDVDRLHAQALDLGASELKAPWDAFWGARYAVVLAPGPLAVGFMSPMDPDHRTPGPEVSDFA